MDVKFSFKKHYYDSCGRVCASVIDLRKLKLFVARPVYKDVRFSFKTDVTDPHVFQAFVDGDSFAASNVEKPLDRHGTKGNDKSKKVSPKVSTPKKKNSKPEEKVDREKESIHEHSLEQKIDVRKNVVFQPAPTAVITEGLVRENDSSSMDNRKVTKEDFYSSDCKEKQYVALCDYTATDASEASFQRDDILKSSSSSSGDVFILVTVVRTNNFGLAPRNYCKEIIATSSVNMKPSTSQKRKHDEGDTPRKRQSNLMDIPQPADGGPEISTTSDNSEVQDQLDKLQQKQKDHSLLIKKIQQEQFEQRSVQTEQQKDIKEIRQTQEEQQIILRHWIEHVKRIDSIVERSPDHQLEDNCREAGLRFNGDTPADGNCFFHAVSDQLTLLGRPLQSVEQLRGNVVRFLRENPKVERSCGNINFTATQPDWQEYLESMSEDGVWADDVILQAAACWLKTNIFIVTSSANGNAEPMYQRAIGDKHFKGTPIRVGHVHGCHFRSLVGANSPVPSPSVCVRSTKDLNAVNLVLPQTHREHVTAATMATSSQTQSMRKGYSTSKQDTHVQLPFTTLHHSDKVVPAIQLLIGKQTETTEFLRTSDSSELTKILQEMLSLEDEDVSDIDKLSKDDKMRRIYGRLAGPVSGVIVDLKSTSSAQIADGLMRIVQAWKEHKGFSQSDARNLAEAVIESDDISNPKKLYKMNKGKAKDFVSKAFKEFQFNIGWQTGDRFPSLTSSDLEDSVQIMKTIYYRVSRNPSESYWGKQIKNYKHQMLDSMDTKYIEGNPKLPEWFEDQSKSDLEGQCSEFRAKMQEQKLTASKSSNIVYLWSVFFGNEFSKRHKIRSYVGIATGGNLCRDRWGQHFRAALQLIKLLLKCDIVPRRTPDFIQYVDLVLALAISSGYESALYCLGAFPDPTAAKNHESQTIKKLKLIQLDRGLNRKT